MHEARHVGVPDAVEHPLAQLDGGVDHCFCPVQSAVGELFPECLGNVVGADQEIGQHGCVFHCHGSTLRDGRRAAVGGVADDDGAAAVPRPVHQVGSEPRVVDTGALVQVGADLVPRAAVGCGEFGHNAGAVLVLALLGPFHEVGIDGVRAGGAVAGDKARPAVRQVGADHVLRPFHERAPDAHARGPGFTIDADGLADS